jgi:hypothetical protein
MLNLCIDWKKVEVEFLGETITAEIKPPTPQHMLVIAPHLMLIDTDTSDEKNTLRIFEIQQAVAPILPEIIRNIEGMEINNKPVDPALLGTEASLGVLCVNLISEVVAASNLNKESEKNLPSPREEQSPGQIAAE